MRKQQTIIVRNNGPLPYADRYDGEDFEIQPGDEAEMLVECATLCLGFGEEDKSRCLRRLGWAFTHTAQAEAMKRLDSFSFHLPGEARPKRSAVPVLLTAPARNETGEDLRESSPGVGLPETPARKLGPLEKLAQAQARAG